MLKVTINCLFLMPTVCYSYCAKHSFPGETVYQHGLFITEKSPFDKDFMFALKEEIAIQCTRFCLPEEIMITSLSAIAHHD